MALPLLALLSGAGAIASYAAANESAEAELRAGEINAKNSEQNAALALEQARDEERQFRRQFRREVGSNTAAVGASGVRMEGSAAEVMRDNAQRAAEDAIRIRRGGRAKHNAFMREADATRRGAADRSRAAKIGGIAKLLGGAESAAKLGGAK